MGTTQSVNKEMASIHDKLEKNLQDSNATPMFIPLDFLKAITNNFSTESELGRGGYGVVYKGVLRSGKIIAVKNRFATHLLDEKTFRDEVSYLMEIKHPNVVQFIGYCAESSWETIKKQDGTFIWAETPKRLLCFEYLCNKNLRKYIYDESLNLKWRVRYEIIKQICSCLNFLHEECRLVHLDLKPENILMDATMIPKIADFGLSRMFGVQESRIFTNNCVGSRGYMAPEYINQGLISKKADIFSLGVIIIEIITGGRDYPNFQLESPESIITSHQHYTEKVLGSWRNKFASTLDHKSLEEYTHQIKQCVTIALKCVDPSMEKRPTAKNIIQEFNAAYQIIGAQLIKCIDANQTEPLIITGHYDGYLKLWNYDMDPQKVVAATKVSRDCVTSVKFIARKRWLLVSVFDYHSIDVYKYEKELKRVTRFKAHDYYVTPFCNFVVHPTQPYVLSTGPEHIKLWDWNQDWNCIQTFEKGSFNINELKLNPEDTNSFATASDYSLIKVWSLDSPESKYTLTGHCGHVYGLDFFTRDGQQYLISGSEDRTAKIWDMQKEECIHTLKHESIVRSVFAHPNLPVLITGADDGSVHFWSSTNFRLKTIHKLWVDERVIGLQFLVGLGRVAAAHQNGVSVMEIRDAEEQGGSIGSNEISISTSD